MQIPSARAADSVAIVGIRGMKLSVTRALFGAALVSGVLLVAAPASAYQAGDMILRVGAAGVLPDSDSEDLATAGFAGGQLEAQDAVSLGITFTYMVTDQLGVGVLASWPFEHDVDGAAAIQGVGTLAETKHLPPTVTLQYHFDTASPVHPFVGLGVNYTYFFDEKTFGPLAGLNLDLKNSWGVAAELGLDYELSDNWLVSGQVWYADIDTEARVAGVDTYDVDIDPWVVMFGVGRKF